VSVDTYLKGKNTSRYTSFAQDGVKILVPPRLIQWARWVRIDAKQFLLWRSFDIEAEHQHTRACRH
jgi:hypothetical protein